MDKYIHLKILSDVNDIDEFKNVTNDDVYNYYVSNFKTVTLDENINHTFYWNYDPTDKIVTYDMTLFNRDDEYYTIYDIDDFKMLINHPNLMFI